MTAQLRLRVTIGEKEAFEAAAQARGLDSSTWQRHLLGIARASWLWVETEDGWQEGCDVDKDSYQLLGDGKVYRWKHGDRRAYWHDDQPPADKVEEVQFAAVPRPPQRPTRRQ